ncbi:MAG: mechanosensitive ion channel [Bacteroidales bacterium]|nr:mechanosensitive ion channel [Bacteroidales bacterium]MCF8350788.1 mechanosensitive ion channel [Bacteroidales bacterium]MCF8376332.1 mechanosensitive ion channel [Bacteroidales bacterium]MCF8400498.1 mechanosensitive ion channel [Bacteroidales bacterium]
MDNSFKEGINLVIEKMSNWITSAIEILPNFVLAIIVLLVFVLLARLAKKGVKRVAGRKKRNSALTSLMTGIAYIAVLIIGIIIALDILALDKTVTSILAGIGILGIALGFAFQDIGANFISGIIIASRKPYQVGDVIKSNDVFGSVKEINLNMTVVETFQGQDVLIPNKEILSNVITNYSVTGARRIDLQAGVSYGDDLDKVAEVSKEAIEKLSFILKDKGVAVQYQEFGGSSINLVIKYWIKYPGGEIIYPDALSEGIVALKKAYDENGITIPFPIRTLDFGIVGGEKLSSQLAHAGI